MEYKFGSYGVQMYGGAIIKDGVLADFPLVGSNLKATSALCNAFGLPDKTFGCLNVAGHVDKVCPDGVLGTRTFDGKVPVGSAVIHPLGYHCDDPLCPVCCLAWARKECKRSMNRFEVFSQVYPDFEVRHITVSVPEYDWGKDLKFMRKQCLNFAMGVGVVGGMCIYHPKRYDRLTKCWFFSPHFHLLGLVAGDGLVDGLVVRDIHNESEYVLKNLERRRSVANTIMYQLSHAGIPFGRVHAVVWFGELNYRKNVHPDLLELVRYNEACAKAEAKSNNKVCPVCGDMMVHVCRVPKRVHFDFERFEGEFVLDCAENWFMVVLPRKKKKVDDG